MIHPVALRSQPGVMTGPVPATRKARILWRDDARVSVAPSQDRPGRSANLLDLALKEQMRPDGSGIASASGQPWGRPPLAAVERTLGRRHFRQARTEIPVLARKPGARRSGAPVMDRGPPGAIERVRRKLAGADHGARQMFAILAVVLTDGFPAVDAACAEALENGVQLRHKSTERGRAFRATLFAPNRKVAGGFPCA